MPDFFNSGDLKMKTQYYQICKIIISYYYSYGNNNNLAIKLTPQKDIWVNIDIYGFTDQDIWYSDDYISAFKLGDIVLINGVDGAVYVYFGLLTQICVTTLIPTHYILIITFSLSDFF